MAQLLICEIYWHKLFGVAQNLNEWRIKILFRNNHGRNGQQWFLATMISSTFQIEESLTQSLSAPQRIYLSYPVPIMSFWTHCWCPFQDRWTFGYRRGLGMGEYYLKQKHKIQLVQDGVLYPAFCLGPVIILKRVYNKTGWIILCIISTQNL